VFALITRLIAGAAVLAMLQPLSAKADDLSGDGQDPARPAVDAAPAPAPAAADASTALPAICTDRPTKSNAACTVDEGHWQYESDLFNGSFIREGGVTTDTYLVTNPTLKYGLTKSIDLEANIAPYEVVSTHDKFGNSSTVGGAGDLYLRLKWNFYNSADGKLSIAAIPYVKAPIARMGIGNGAFEGGLILPIDYKLTEKITLATVPEVDDFKDSVGDGHHVNTAQLVNVGYSLPANVTVYGELWGDWNYDPVKEIDQYSADVAAAWGVTNYFQLDAGLNFGLNRYTPGVQAYFGVSQKF
jgi:hypothetical protein